MIGSLRGVVGERLGDWVIVEVGGIGFQVVMPEGDLMALPVQGHEVLVYTHLIWKEDAITLYGFLEKEAREMFRMLIQVSGVGPRTALSCLSVLGPVEVLKALSAGDTRRLQGISGIGKKTAGRLCVELGEKARRLLSAKSVSFGEEGLEPGLLGHGALETSLWHQAFSGLENLGYRPTEIRQVLSRVMREMDVKEGDGLKVQDLIKSALKYLQPRCLS